MPADAKVVGIDCIPQLCAFAVENVMRFDAALLLEGSVSFVCGDGNRGWENEQPFDVIHVGAACESFPQMLFDQLAPNGMLLAPIDAHSQGDDKFQTMHAIFKEADGSCREKQDIAVQYVPLINEK